MNHAISFNSNYLNSWVFSSNYDPVCTNISSLFDAQIIVLPEFHYIENDQMRNAWIINQLYREGDVVLIESPKDESETFHQISKVSRTITVRGWDCPESDEALHKAKEPFYDLYNRLFAIDGFGNEHRRILSEAIENGPCKTDELFKKDFLSELDSLDFLEPNLRKGLFYNRIRSWHEQNGEVGRVLANTFSKRQKSLIRKCQQFFQTNNRIFIIAGAAHAFSQAEDNQSFKEGVKLLHDYLKEKRFVIFNNDRHITNLLKADVKLCLMMSSIEKTVIKICGRASKFFFFFLILFTCPIGFPCYMLYTRNR